MYKYILASNSPRRIELLKTILNEFEIIPSNFNEDILKSNISKPSTLVTKLSYAKALDIFNIYKNRYEKLVVIGGDTLVVSNNEFMGKPKDEKEAHIMLSKLQGTFNEVYTGHTVIVKNDSNIDKKFGYSMTKVYMKSMTDKDIQEYISTKEPLDKAGAYAIQGYGAKYINKYEGNYTSVIGMNTDLIKEFLSELKVL